MAKYASLDERIGGKVKGMLGVTKPKKAKKPSYKNGKSTLHSGGKLHKGKKK
jgi:hypothetical protein